MSDDLERRLNDVCESLEAAKQEFEQATKLLSEVLEVMHNRIERLEEWMDNKANFDLTIRAKIERLEKWKESGKKVVLA